MRLMIIGQLEGHISQAGKIALQKLGEGVIRYRNVRVMPL